MPIFIRRSEILEIAHQNYVMKYVVNLCHTDVNYNVAFVLGSGTKSN